MSYVAGHALLLRDPGGLVGELSELCASAGAAGDGARPEILRRIEFGMVPPGGYLALAWIEFQWPPAVPRDSTRVKRYFGVTTWTVSVGADTVKLPFLVGRPAFKRFDAHAKALSCLEFLVVPAPTERVVTPMPGTNVTPARRGI